MVVLDIGTTNYSMSYTSTTATTTTTDYCLNCLGDNNDDDCYHCYRTSTTTATTTAPPPPPPATPSPAAGFGLRSFRPRSRCGALDVCCEIQFSFPKMLCTPQRLHLRTSCTASSFLRCVQICSRVLHPVLCNTTKSDKSREAP